MDARYLNDEELQKELSRCLQCAAKPCLKACPVKCSPYDFIKAAKSKDWKTAASHISEHNPLGEICGLVCPDKFCVQYCVRAQVDKAIAIPAVQATIMKKNREIKQDSAVQNIKANGKKVAVIGFGPAGMGAASKLLANGFSVTVFEKEKIFGGALNLIPSYRLPREVVQYECQKFMQNPLFEVRFSTMITDYGKLLQEGFAAVIATVGEQKKRELKIKGAEFAIDYNDYLDNREKYRTQGAVAVIGGGSTAVDCAVCASLSGASAVEMFVRRGAENMRITAEEKQILMKYGIKVSNFTRPAEIIKNNDEFTLLTLKTCFDKDGNLQDVNDCPNHNGEWKYIIKALGNVRDKEPENKQGIYYAGDYVNGSSTVVEAIASGKKVAEEIINKYAD